MKEVKPGYYLSMSEMIEELNAEITAGSNTINFHSDGFNIRFDYDSSSNKFVVNMSHEVSTKMEESDLAMRRGFKENIILCGSVPVTYPFMTNMKRYTAFYVCTDTNQNQSVSGVRAPLLRVLPVKSRYGVTTCNR